MKQLISIFAIAFTLNSFSQDYTKLAEVTFESAEECKEAEPQVLECANYLLNTTVKSDELNRLSAFQYIFKWMEGTADYTFSIDSEVLDLTKGNTDFMTIYFAAMVQTVLQNNGETMSDEALHETAVNKLADYCSDNSKGLKPNRAIKKVINKRKKD
ncbi:hypothetical protein [Winogradskyella sp.]|uniref:hypothetical protein n=1 Tax=Winogradskyella sp. TaxID=1883156 RepID=UPI003F6AFB34